MSAIIDELDNRLSKYWDKKSSDKKPPVKLIVCNVSGAVTYLPVYQEDRNFVYIASNNLYVIVKTKCKLLKTERKTLYYEAMATDDDISIGKYPIRPIGCPKTINELGLTELAGYETAGKI